MNLAGFEILFFDSAKEASSDVTTFLNIRFITTQKPAYFRENITCSQAPSQEGFVEGTRLFAENGT